MKFLLRKHTHVYVVAADDIIVQRNNRLRERERERKGERWQRCSVKKAGLVIRQDRLSRDDVVATERTTAYTILYYARFKGTKVGPTTTSFDVPPPEEQRRKNICLFLLLLQNSSFLFALPFDVFCFLCCIHARSAFESSIAISLSLSFTSNGNLLEARRRTGPHLVISQPKIPAKFIAQYFWKFIFFFKQMQLFPRSPFLAINF